MSGPPIIRLKIAFDDNARLGPGKMDLLEAVKRAGSISAAGRELGMSYRRAWLLLDAVNTMFGQPAIETSAGGSHGGGARLTAFGEKLLAAYRSVEAETARLAEQAFADLVPLRKAQARA
ncbi:LysR family transcriptional regulator [Labrys sp. LIt4]|uniref:LysR family transcriptional regulator n=1 Tax=Labrys okinawensis TaxID=346911 RepID=A0A2S9Q9F5_9HYPH|nr:MULTISPECIES: LysR family transcriptional regulator [Labrys]MBP0581730.1 LysR family transcriptional regulator [Labrys sp. LIt4]PRH85988.1 LysR family transcriptional regulator [Labrys okinawensis]